MLQVLIFALIAFAIFKLAPGPAFLTGFAALLDRPERGYAGLWARLTLTQFVGGEHGGRPVVLVLHPRQRYRMGYLVLGVATKASFSWSGSKPSDGPVVTAAPLREALDALIGEHHLSLELEDGWLRATWMPTGMFNFPGRFDEKKWRGVLANIHKLAVALESARPSNTAATFEPATVARPSLH